MSSAASCCIPGTTFEPSGFGTRPLAPAYLSMIFSENRFPLFGIMLQKSEAMPFTSQSP
jgi:hypothetical protein